MMHPSWFAPAALLAGLASTPALAHGDAHGGATVAVGIPPVIVDVGDVHVVVGAPPPPPVVVQQAPPPVVVVREVVRSTVVVYPRHRPAPAPMVREVIVVEDEHRCDHPGQHKGHHKGHHKDGPRGGHEHGGDHRDDDRGHWR
ncbi:MAG: hypothetical protein IT382_23190 [Deltaproteobacteria bacterium]|nr:hypothetical protein [Deltaproteobacteria bacterium]